MNNNIQQQIDYYKSLIKDDNKRLKNSTGGSAEEILHNLQVNKKKLNQLKRQLKS